MPLRALLRAPVRALGVARSPRAVELLRDSGLYVPFRILYEGLPAQERRRWNDFREFRRNWGPVLREVKGPGGDGPPILFPHMSVPGLYRLRIDGMLAKALELRGCRPRFVLERHDLWHEEYLRAMGFRDFVYLDDSLPERAPLERRANELAAECSSLEDVLELSHDGYEVGRHAASRVLNRLRRGFLDLSDPEVAAELRWSLTNSLVSATAAARIYDDVRPAKLVTSVQNYTPWAEFYETALRRDVDTLYWSHSHLEGTLLFRRFSYEDRHEHYFTLSDETWQELRRIPWTREDGEAFVESMRQSYLQGTWFERKKTLRGKRLKSGEEIRAQFGLDPARKTAVVFSHILYDATFWYGRNLFADYGEWLVATVEAACANPNVNWVIKLHPENVMRWEEATGSYSLEDVEDYRLLRDRFPELPDHVRLMPPEDDTNTVSLFDFADYAVTVRGTVGLEFPCFGVPVLTGGTGGYSGRGFTIDSDTPEEYLARLASIQEIPRLDEEQVALAQRFSSGVFHLKPVRMETFTWSLMPDEEWDVGMSAHRFELLARSAGDVRRGRDLNRFADWALDSQRRELLSVEGEELLAGQVLEAVER
jgi:hypothetical protein